MIAQLSLRFLILHEFAENDGQNIFNDDQATFETLNWERLCIE